MLSPWFLSDETGLPFSHCLHCRMPLSETDTIWLIQKDYQRGECILEYAICLHCRHQVAEKSPETEKAAVREFLETQIDWDARRAEFAMMADPAERLEACIACRSPRTSLEAFSISAQFDSDGHLVESALPFLLCEPCNLRMLGPHHESSRASWQQYFASLLEGPPGD